VLTAGVLWWESYCPDRRRFGKNAFAVLFLAAVRFLLGAGEKQSSIRFQQFVSRWIHRQSEELPMVDFCRRGMGAA